MGRILTDQPVRPGEGILRHLEGVDLMPADIQLSGMEVSLVNAMSRETILRQYLDTVKGQYSHILIDYQPSLGMLTVNALAAANRIIIPVQAEYLPAKGLEQLLSTVAKVKRQINPKLQMQYILANTVLKKEHDGRISRDNKAWAKTIPMPDDGGDPRHSYDLVVDKVNPGLTDLFLKQARKVLQAPEKGSVLEKLKQESLERKPAAPKKREPER